MFSRVVAKNFLSWKELDFEVPKGATLIQGFNYDDQTSEGSGKSAIPNAICWGLFGCLPKEAKVDDVIREGAKGCAVAIGLSNGAVISRTRKPNDLALVLPNGEVRKGKDAKETQAWIEEYIGFSFDTFCQAVYFAQNYPKKFLTATEEERAKILSEIQSLEVFDRARKRTLELIRTEEIGMISIAKDVEAAKAMITSETEHLAVFKHLLNQAQKKREEELSQLWDRHEILSNEALSLSEKYPQNFLKQSQEDKAALDEAVEECRKNLQAKIKKSSAAVEQAKAFKNLTIEIKELNKEYVGIQTKLSELDNLPDLAELEAELTGLEAEQESLNKEYVKKCGEVKAAEESETLVRMMTGSLENIKAELHDASEELKKSWDTDKPTCNKCGSVLSEAKFEKQLKELAETKTKLEAKKAEIEGFLKEKGSTGWVELERQAKDLGAKLHKTGKNVKEIRDLISKTKISVSGRESLTQLLKGIKAKTDKNLKLLDDIPNPDIAKLTSEVSDAQAELDELEQARNNLQTLISDATSGRQKIESLTAQVQDLNGRIEKLKAQGFADLEGKIRDSQTKLNEYTEDLETVANLIKNKKEYIAQLELLRDGFKAVKSYSFQGALSDLTRRTNRFLEDLFEIPVSIKFYNESEEGSVSKIRTQLVFAGTERPLGLLSGGQSRRLQLSVDFALSEMIASRGSKPVNFRILDECMKDLSESSMEKILRILEGFKGSTLLIEHNSVFKNMVANTFDVELIDGISRKAG